MKLKSLLVMKAIVCLVLGIPILFVPIFFYGLFGMSLGSGGVFTAREYGASLMGNLLLTWFARNAIDSAARRAIVMALCVYDGVGFVITLIATLSGLANPLGWLAVAIYLFFAVGFGYYLVYRPAAQVQPHTAS